MNRYHPAALVITGLVLLALSACTTYDVRTAIPDLPEQAAPPPLLEFEHPYPGLVYTTADDLDPDTPGIQLEARIRVEDLANDLWLDDVALEIDDVQQRLTVVGHELGPRIASAIVTFDAPERTNVRLDAAATDDLGRTQVTFQVAR